MSDFYRDLLAIWQERYRLEEVLEVMESEGVCVAVLNDDFGRWALSTDRIQEIPEGIEDEPQDLVTTVFVAKDAWKDSLYEAVTYFLLKCIEDEEE